MAAISTFAGIENAEIQTLVWRMTGTSNMAALSWECTCNGNQTLPSGNATFATDNAGRVPAAGDSGIPAIYSIDSAASAYIKQLRFSATTGGVRCLLYDRLYSTGYFNLGVAGTTALSGQPSFASRLPGGSYANTLLLYEMYNSPGGGTPTVSVSYTNELGVSGRTAQSFGGGGAFTVRNMGLQVGDKGVQRIDSVTIGSGGTTGQPAFIIARPLAYFRIDTADNEITLPLDVLGFIPIYPTSALCWIFVKEGDSSVRPTISVEADIVSPADASFTAYVGTAAGTSTVSGAGASVGGVTVYLDNFTGSGNLSTHSPDVGSNYTVNSGSLSALALDGSGHLAFSTTSNNYAQSGISLSTSAYSLEAVVVLTAVSSNIDSSSGGMQVDLALATSGTFLAEMFLQWQPAPPQNIAYTADVYNSSGTTLFDTSSNIFPSITVGTPFLVRADVTPSGTAFYLNNTALYTTAQKPNVVPNEVVLNAYTMDGTTDGYIDYMRASEIIVLDTFTGTDGTVVLTAPHTGEVGATWTLVPTFGPGDNDEFVIKSNSLQRPVFGEFGPGTSAGEALIYASGTLPGGTTAYTIEFGFTFSAATAGGSGAFIAIYEKCDTSPAFIFQVGINVLGASGNTIGLSHDGGTNSASFAFTDGHEYVAKLSVNSTSMVLTVLDAPTQAVKATTSWTRGSMPTSKFGIDMYDGASAAVASTTYFRVCV